VFNVVCCQSHRAFLLPGTLYARHAQAMWLFFRVSKPNAPIVKLSVINQNLDTLVSRVGLTCFVLGFQKIEASKKEIFSDTIMEFGIEINTENILLRSCKITNCN